LHIDKRAAFCKLSDSAVPGWFDGKRLQALRQVGKYGDGWIGFNLMPDRQPSRLGASKRF
jgi:hypothetical protein